MKKIIISVVALMLTFISCSKVGEDNGISTEPQSGEMVDFSAIITSRVTSSTFEANDQITISSYSSGEVVDSWVEYTWDEATFTSSTPILKVDGLSLSYIGVYPAKSSSSFSHTVAPSQNTGDNYQESDLLVAQIDATTSNSVTLDFNHVMAQFNIALIINDKRSDNNKDSEIEITNLTFNLPSGSTVQCNVETKSYVASGSAISITPAMGSDSRSYTAIFAPQSVANSYQILTATIEGSDEKWLLNGAMTFKSGNSYSCQWEVAVYDDKVVSQEATVITSSITGWSNKGAVSGEEVSNDDF